VSTAEAGNGMSADAGLRSSHRRSASFRALDFRFSLVEDDPWAFDAATAALALLRAEPGDDPEGEHRYEIRVATARHAEIVVDGTTIHLVADGAEAVAWLLWHVNQQAAIGSSRYLLLHSAAVELGGRALLVPGSSGAGKSTTCAALVQAGAGYLTDELVALEPRTTTVVPFAKSLHLDHGARHALGIGEGSVEPGHAAAPDHVAPSVLASHPIGSPCVPRWIAFPDRDGRDGAGSDIVRLSAPDALVELLAHSVNLDRHGGKGLEVLAELAQSCKCYRLTYGDAGSAAKELLSEIGLCP
jgi:hypothetical protein